MNAHLDYRGNPDERRHTATFKLVREYALLTAARALASRALADVDGARAKARTRFDAANAAVVEDRASRIPRAGARRRRVALVAATVNLEQEDRVYAAMRTQLRVPNQPARLRPSWANLGLAILRNAARRSRATAA